MDINNVNIAEAYYGAMAEKNLKRLGEYLHPDVQFKSPFKEILGKEVFLDVVKEFMTLFETLTIRAKCGSDNQVMLAYDVDFPAPIGKLPTAALMAFQEGLIARIELFFDTRVFDKK
ncbi:MAG: nuclear transport factor 2 family protein [Alphaproteobacteria bacterium]|nr:nuclear transport factor 2 family protein [Alphaproteobacteria bacterium]